MVDYKGKIGIYKAKSQAKYLGEQAVEYHLKTGHFKGISQGGEDERSKFHKVVSSWCEIAKFRTMRKIPLRNFGKVKFTLRNGVPIACARVST